MIRKALIVFLCLMAFICQAQQEKKNIVFKVRKQVKIEKAASFNGGDLNTFSLWVQSNCIYPTAAMEAGISGNVIVYFTIDTKGKVQNVRVLKSVHAELDKEAIRAVSNSPIWKPATAKNGKAVEQTIAMPINFQIQ